MAADLFDGNKKTGEATSGSNFHIQTAMVLFALEEALGSFVVQAVPQPDALPQAMRSEIEKRIQRSGFIPVAQIVQETYIKEIIDLAVAASHDRSEGDALARLRKLVEALDAFEIRNAVCHPNRQFPECYWYRMAALATDPCIEQLRLLRVTDAFQCAIEGRLNPPPEGWLEQRSWSVPNNLPSTFDHQVTGLIARQEEAKSFRKLLQNMRNSLLAIVGPGGTGKTALCLEVLRECLLDPSTLQWAQQLVYVSAKTETLTIRGVEPIVDL